MALENQSHDNKVNEESVLGQPCAAILNDKDWSYLKKYYKMSRRELQVAKLVCQGLTNADIAKTLRVQPGTVKTHLRSVFSKTRSRNRISMLLKYLEKVQIFHNQIDIKSIEGTRNKQQNKEPLNYNITSEWG